MSDLKAINRETQAKMARVAARKVIGENREALTRVVIALAKGNINLACDGLDLVIESLSTVRKDLG